jgi:membrane associated rhomboid family serine protease/pSer/pThr/pTyr-binding forkhead associated (FHA) protein
VIELKCDCGSGLEIPASFAGEPAGCPRCGRALRAVAGGALDDHAAAPTCRLVVGAAPVGISEGPGQGEVLFLAGEKPIEVGKSEGKSLRLPGKLVSRSHCRLVPTGADWRVEDLGSTNGLFINSSRVKTHTLRHGDVLTVGDYEFRFLCGDGFAAEGAVAAATDEPVEAELEGISVDDAMAAAAAQAEAGEGEGEYDVADEPPPPPRPVRHALPARTVAVSSSLVPGHSLTTAALGPPLSCPSCHQTKVPGAKICVECGIDMRTGRPILLSQELDENALVERAENTLRVISWLLRIGWIPIGSEAFGTHKPYVIWAASLVTLLSSFWFFGQTWGSSDNYPRAGHLLLWSGDLHWLEPSFDPSRLTARERNEFRSFERSSAYEELVANPEIAQFHWYQLFTHALLHEGVLHLAGNLVFMLVLGLRVNALIGNVRTVIIYPLLAVGAGAAQMLASAHGRPMPSLGASGATMGLAGMYLVLFPIHRIYMCVWYRVGIYGAFQLLTKIWPVRGFWVVLFYISFDVLATLFGTKDGVGHWAHLGGFFAGIAVALLLLMARQVNARGGDLISVTLGKHAWALVGRPRSDNLAADDDGPRLPGPAPA